MDKLKDFILDNNILYLVVGTIFSVFSIGRYNIVISIYIWPFCFLHYLHKNEFKIIPLIIVSLCLLFSNMFRWIGSTDLNIGVDFLLGAYFSVINIIPFLIDDIFYKKISAWKNALIFPLSVASCEFLFHFNVIANTNLYAYAHRENLQYLQIISLFGVYFLSFVIALFSSILTYSLKLFSLEKRLSKMIFSYMVVILIIYFFGFIRLLIPQDKETYNVACSIGISQNLYAKGEESVLPLEEYYDYINNRLEMANSSNCQFMIFAEEAFAIIKKDREKIINKVKELAEKYNIFVVLPLDIEEDELHNTNEAILISEKGDVLYNYQKQHLIPYIEKDYYENMDKVEVIDTKYGKLTTVICYDINFPYFLNLLSRKHFDLLLVPSWDWEGIAEYHSNELKYRAIEGGFNAIKNTANGITISNDAKGRTLTYYREKDYEDYFVISTVNRKGVKTLYSYIGFLFNYIYIISIICILISGPIYEKLCGDKRRSSTLVMKKLNDLTIDYEED